MNSKIISLIFALLLCDLSAGSPSPTSYVVQGWNSECFFLMRSSFEGKKFLGIGTCYEIKEDGTFEKLWQIEGEYSFEGRIFLGGEGKKLVRIVDIFQPQPDPEGAKLAQQTALQFYNEGKLIKQVSVNEVVDTSKLHSSGMPGVRSTHQIFNYDDATAPKMGRLPYFDFFDDEDKETMKKQ